MTHATDAQQVVHSLAEAVKQNVPFVKRDLKREAYENLSSALQFMRQLYGNDGLHDHPDYFSLIRRYQIKAGLING